MITLNFETISDFNFTVDDSGTSAYKDVSLWSPDMPSSGGWYLMGEAATQVDSTTIMPNAVWIVQALNNGVVMTPNVTADCPLYLYMIPPHTTGTSTGVVVYSFRDFGIFQPTAPDGFYALGIWGYIPGVGINGNTRQYYVFVDPSYLVEITDLTTLTQIYTNKGAPTSQDITLWRLPNSGCIVQSTGPLGSYPSGTIYDIPVQGQGQQTQFDRFVMP